MPLVTITTKVDASFADIVRESDTLLALMGEFEARNGPFSGASGCHLVQQLAAPRGLRGESRHRLSAAVMALWLARATSPGTAVGVRLSIISTGAPAGPTKRVIKLGHSNTVTACSRAARSSVARSRCRILTRLQRARKRKFSAISPLVRTAHSKGKPPNHSEAFCGDAGGSV
jgi:hypothetical protein